MNLLLKSYVVSYIVITRTHIYSSIGPSLLDLVFRLLAGGGAWPCGQASHFGKPIPRMRGRGKTDDREIDDREFISRINKKETRSFINFNENLKQNLAKSSLNLNEYFY